MSLNGPQLVFGAMVTLIGLFLAAIMILPTVQAAAAHRELREQGQLHTAIVDEKWTTKGFRPLRTRFHLQLSSPDLEEPITMTTARALHREVDEGDEVKVYVKNGDAILEGHEVFFPWHVVLLGAAIAFAGLGVMLHAIRRASGGIDPKNLPPG